jgi:LmbE family N-acetylglucosaminyl deacetylase
MSKPSSWLNGNYDVLIFAPHCDDVPLSIGGTLLGGALGKRIHVAVVFSTSCYSVTPSANGDPDEVTRIRHFEELAAAKMADYEVTFMGFPEPFVRPGYRNLREIFDPRKRVHDDSIWPMVNDAIISRLSTATGLVLSPLRCGHHIDHRIVFESVVSESMATSRCLIGLYEDLPYAARLLDEAILSLVPDLPSGPFRPITMADVPFKSKVALLENYSSQLTYQDLELVFLHWSRRAGERLWLSPAAIGAIQGGERSINKVS